MQDALSGEQRLYTEKISRDRSEIQRSKEQVLEDQRTSLSSIYESRSQLAEERARVEALQKTFQEQKHRDMMQTATVSLCLSCSHWRLIGRLDRRWDSCSAEVGSGTVGTVGETWARPGETWRRTAAREAVSQRAETTSGEWTVHSETWTWRREIETHRTGARQRTDQEGERTLIATLFRFTCIGREEYRTTTTTAKISHQSPSTRRANERSKPSVSKRFLLHRCKKVALFPSYRRLAAPSTHSLWIGKDMLYLSHSSCTASTCSSWCLDALFLSRFLFANIYGVEIRVRFAVLLYF